MDIVIVAAVVGLITAILSTVAVGLAVFYLFKKNIVEPLPVYDEPLKKRQIIVPGDGVYTVHEKRKAKHTSDYTEWLKEQRETR